MSRLDSAIAEISAMRVRSDSDILVTDGIAGGATQITGFRRVSLRAIVATASSHGFDAGVPIAHGSMALRVFFGWGGLHEMLLKRTVGLPDLFSGRADA